MTVFVAHNDADKCRLIASELQRKYPKECFIPARTTFSHLYDGFFEESDICEIETDLLSNCDEMLLASKPNAIMQRQVDFCRLVGIEVRQLENQCREV